MRLLPIAATAAAPTGTVTFLFTDIEGGTRLWEERRAAHRDAYLTGLGDRANDALDRGRVMTPARLSESALAVITDARSSLGT